MNPPEDGVAAAAGEVVPMMTRGPVSWAGLGMFRINHDFYYSLSFPLSYSFPLFFTIPSSPVHFRSRCDRCG